MEALTVDTRLVNEELHTSVSMHNEDMVARTQVIGELEASTSGRESSVEPDSDEEELWRLAFGQLPFSLSLLLILMRDSLLQGSGKGGKLELSRAVYGITHLARQSQEDPPQVEWQNGFDALKPGHKLRWISFISTLETQVSLVNKGHCEYKGSPGTLIKLLHGLAVMGRCNSTLINGLLSLLVAQTNTESKWVSQLESWQVIKLAWSLASLRWSPSSSPERGDLIVNEIFEASRPVLSGLGFSRASSLAWSMARISSPSHVKADRKSNIPGWWESLEAATMLQEASHHGQERIKPRQAVALIWASGRLRPNPRPSAQWMRGLMSLIESNASLDATEVTMLMDGLAALRYRPPDALAHKMSLASPVDKARQKSANQLGHVQDKNPIESLTASQLHGLLASSVR